MKTAGNLSWRRASGIRLKETWKDSRGFVKNFPTEIWLDAISKNYATRREYFSIDRGKAWDCQVQFTKNDSELWEYSEVVAI